jgi:hypothetical protein
MIILDATTKKLELETSAAVSVDFSSSHDDITTTTFASSGTRGNVATATTVTLAAAPAASTQRIVKRVAIKNRSTTLSQTVSVKLDISATDFYLTPSIVLRPGESLCYNDTDGWCVHASNGSRKEAEPVTIDDDRVRDWLKTNSAGEVSGINPWYCSGKDAGYPGAWSPGTSGVAGRATDGTTAADIGSLTYANAPSPLANYLTRFNVASSVAGRFGVVDVLWVNDALSPTTTTIQAVNSVALPARDAIGGTNGLGCCAGILVTAATTNGADITTITLDYTNSAGTGTRTGTMAGFATTANIGTVHWFELQAGDTGVRSIQNITLGTSMVTGTFSLFIGRRLCGATVPIINSGSYASPLPPSGVRTYDGTCALLFNTSINTGAAATRGEVAFTAR